jgi:hypothetical protein
MNTVLFEYELYTEERTEWISVHVPDHEKDKAVARQWRGSPWKPCIDWCKERFGYANYLPMVWCYNGDGWFEFEREADAVLFALRWL